MPMIRHSQARLPVNFLPDGKPLPGAGVIDLVRRETDTILMSFSCGKDSIAAWLAIRDKFPNIVPFYMQLIPDLEFVDESLAYYEKAFGCKILKLLHPSLYRMLNYAVWQPPDRLRFLDAANIPMFDYDMLNEMIIEDQGLPDHTFVCAGVRAADSPNRRSAINQYGAINWKRRYFYPVWDMVKDELISLISSSGIKLPVDYRLFGRSFDGIDYRFLKPLKDNFPRDYQRILEWFPLAELELMRYENE